MTNKKGQVYMRLKKLLPIIILVTGIFVITASHIFSNIVKVPTITEKEFPFSVTYQMNAENKKVEGTYRCVFSKDSGSNADPRERFYDGTHVETGEKGTVRYKIAEKDGKELVLFLEFHADYLMGDPNYDNYYEDYSYEPRLLVYDKEGYEYDDEESLSQFNTKIISWDFPEPIENSFKFSHIGRVSSNSVLPMLVVTYIILVICVVFISKDKERIIKPIDKASTVLKFIISLACAPLMASVALLTQIYTSGNELIYQIFYCIPAFTVFCVAISVCLCRKGYSKAGFLVQFAGPVVFVISLLIEPF